MKLKVVVPQTSFRRVVEPVLLFFGLACLGFFSYDYVSRYVHQFYEGWQFDHETVESQPQLKHTLPVVLPNPDRPARATAALPPYVVGRIAIPRLRISAMVEEGIDDSTLARAVGHIPGTALPGEPGNIGIAGHRDTFFRALKDLQPHDKIDFTTHSGRFHYTVESLTIVEPDDVSVLRPTPVPTLTIVTCFPFRYIGNAPRRFIVHAVSD